LLEPIQWRPELKKNVATYINLTTTDRTYSKLIGIHVRSPQYKKHLKSFKKSVKMAGGTYFKNAMNYFREKFSNPLFMVVSDDMEWCRRTIKGSDVIYAGE
jgi:galactoside 2-L-fucosyltransferase 1/2